MFDDRSMLTINELPSAYRIVSTSCVPATNGHGVTYLVELYHDKACVTVTFNRAHPDIRIHVNQLVSVWWNHPPVVRTNGAIQIANFVMLDYPSKCVDMFETVLPRWQCDRELIRQIREMLETLPIHIQQIVKAALWDGRRFKRFCKLAASRYAVGIYRLENPLDANKIEASVRAMADGKMKVNASNSKAEAFLQVVGKMLELETI